MVDAIAAIRSSLVTVFRSSGSVPTTISHAHLATGSQAGRSNGAFALPASAWAVADYSSLDWRYHLKQLRVTEPAITAQPRTPRAPFRSIFVRSFACDLREATIQNS